MLLISRTSGLGRCKAAWPHLSLQMIRSQKETDPRIVMLCGMLAASTW
jgi:hypothetical protein